MDFEFFRETGYQHISQAIKIDTILEYVDTYSSILFQQLSKMGFESFAAKNEDSETVELTDFYVRSLDIECRPALAEASTMARNSAIGHTLAVEATNSIVELFDNQKHIQVSGPSLFVNLPGNPRGKYTAHAESHWYPKRNNFVNLWIPIIRPRNTADGMIFYEGSQKQKFSFCEYIGYAESTGELLNKQYEIPSELLKDFRVIGSPNCGIGDLIVFDRSLVHSSVDNPYSYPLYALTVRVFDYSRDYTISSNWAETPYSSPSPLWKRLQISDL